MWPTSRSTGNEAPYSLGHAPPFETDASAQPRPKSSPSDFVFHDSALHYLTHVEEPIELSQTLQDTFALTPLPQQVHPSQQRSSANIARLPPNDARSQLPVRSFTNYTPGQPIVSPSYRVAPPSQRQAQSPSAFPAPPRTQSQFQSQFQLLQFPTHLGFACPTPSPYQNWNANGNGGLLGSASLMDRTDSNLSGETHKAIDRGPNPFDTPGRDGAVKNSMPGFYPGPFFPGQVGMSFGAASGARAVVLQPTQGAAMARMLPPGPSTDVMGLGTASSNHKNSRGSLFDIGGSEGCSGENGVPSRRRDSIQAGQNQEDAKEVDGAQEEAKEVDEAQEEAKEVVVAQDVTHHAREDMFQAQRSKIIVLRLPVVALALFSTPFDPNNLAPGEDGGVSLAELESPMFEPSVRAFVPMANLDAETPTGWLSRSTQDTENGYRGAAMSITEGSANLEYEMRARRYWVDKDGETRYKDSDGTIGTVEDSENGMVTRPLATSIANAITGLGKRKRGED